MSIALGFDDRLCQLILLGFSFKSSMALGLPESSFQSILSLFFLRISIALGFEDKYCQLILYLLSEINEIVSVLSL